MNYVNKPKRPSRISQGADFWKKHLQQWRTSDHSQSDYCRQQHIALGTFHSWKTKLRGSSFLTPVKPKRSFIPVKVTASHHKQNRDFHRRGNQTARRYPHRL